MNQKEIFVFFFLNHYFAVPNETLDLGKNHNGSQILDERLWGTLQWRDQVKVTWTRWSIFFSFPFFFLWPYLQHMEVASLGIESELQLRPTPQLDQHRIRATSVTYATASAMPDP